MRQREHLTGGDAAAIVALLVFILAWAGGWAWSLSEPSDKELRDADDIAVALLLFAMVGPLFWAGGLVRAVISNTTNAESATRPESGET